MSEPCSLCPHRIKVGSWIGLHFASGLWVHVGCLIRDMHRQVVDTNTASC